MSTKSPLTVKQAAKRLGLSEKTVYNLLKREDARGNPVLGRYMPVPGSQCVRIGEHHLEAYLDAVERKASESPARAMLRRKNPAASRKLVYVRKG